MNKQYVISEAFNQLNQMNTKHQLNEDNKKIAKMPLTWKEFYDLALKNYEKGGDGIVECWDENTFNEYVAEFGPITKEVAMNMFRSADEIYRDITGYADW